MKLLVQTAIIFFGTLLAAALLALGDPGRIAPTILQGESVQAAPAAPVNVAATRDSQVAPPDHPAR